MDRGICGRMEKLARKWHRGQFRKGRGKVPYIVHPRAVARQLVQWGVNAKDSPLPLCLAYGHDLLEECGKSTAELLEAVKLRCDDGFARQIVSGIQALSFLPEGGLSDEEYDRRKAEYIANIARNAQPEVLMVKMSDRICNTRDFLCAGKVKKARNYLEAGKILFVRVDELPYAEAIKRTLAELEADIVASSPIPGQRMTEETLNVKWKDCPIEVVRAYPITLASVTQRALAVNAPSVHFCIRPALKNNDEELARVERIFCCKASPDEVDDALEAALVQSGSHYRPVVDGDMW